MASNRPMVRGGPAQAETAPGSKVVNLITGLVVLRVYNALGLQTFFQPDEYFQSLEPAWKLVFGEGSGAWITWEWREHLRSSLHPLLFSGVYKATVYLCDQLQYPSHVRPGLLIAAPKFLQAAFAACTDLFTYRLACNVYGSRTPMAAAALLLTIFSPWQWFCSVRTFSNSLETTLTVVALDLWPWDWIARSHLPDEQSHGGTIYDGERQQELLDRDAQPPNTLYASLTAAAVACVLRPTNLIVWATVSFHCAFSYAIKFKVINLARATILTGSAVLALSVALDRWYYNELVFPPLRFIHFNVVQSLSIFYGKNRFDYYFTEGLPLLLTAALPFAATGVAQSRVSSPFSATPRGLPREQHMRRALARAVVASILTLSLISHKEVRFIYPLLPMLHVLAARPLVAFFEPIWNGRKRYRAILLVLGLALNAVVGYYVSYVHQRGVVDVVHHLRHEYETHYQARNGSMSVGFLMPCHSTPWRSHLIYPEIEAWALTCEPPLGLTREERKGYLDEADVFYADPALWIDRNMEGRERSKLEVADGRAQQVEGEFPRKWPGYLVFFAQLESTMQKAVAGNGYKECWRGFNTHWHDDWRRKGDVIVWCTRRT